MPPTTNAPANVVGPGDDLAVSVGMLADRLLHAIRDNGSTVESAQRELLEHALAVAAEAEQRLTEQSQRIAVLETLSLTDEVTRLLNRRGFLRELARVLAEAKRHGDTGMLVYIDIDDFKTVNDACGHQGGDHVLRYVGDLLASQVRETDVVGRWAGDEFVVLLVKSDPKTGRQRARELERLVNGASVRYGGTAIALHASFGVVPYHAGEVPEDLLERADKAMYRRKRTKPRLVQTAD